MQSVLVTGGTGRLGRAVVDRLDNLGCEVKVLTRRVPGPGAAMAAHHVVGDLRTAEGLDDAVSGASVIVHCATTYGKGDVAAVRHLIETAGRVGREPHLIFVSIVGADAIPVAYYRAKVAAERMVMASGLPWTIQRATQFHDLVAGFFARQRLMPFMLTLNGLRFQPIDVGDVADRLTELARGGPTGRAPDIGGPQVRTMRDLATTFDAVHRRRRRIVSLPAPGRMLRGFTSGANLAPDNAFGKLTFEEFLVAQLAGRAR